MQKSIHPIVEKQEIDGAVEEEAGTRVDLRLFPVHDVLVCVDLFLLFRTMAGRVARTLSPN